MVWVSSNVKGGRGLVVYAPQRGRRHVRVALQEPTTATASSWAAATGSRRTRRRTTSRGSPRPCPPTSTARWTGSSSATSTAGSGSSTRPPASTSTAARRRSSRPAPGPADRCARGRCRVMKPTPTCWWSPPATGGADWTLAGAARRSVRDPHHPRRGRRLVELGPHHRRGHHPARRADLLPADHARGRRSSPRAPAPASSTASTATSITPAGPAAAIGSTWTAPMPSSGPTLARARATGWDDKSGKIFASSVSRRDAIEPGPDDVQRERLQRAAHRRDPAAAGCASGSSGRRPRSLTAAHLS